MNRTLTILQDAEAFKSRLGMANTVWSKSVNKFVAKIEPESNSEQDSVSRINMYDIDDSTETGPGGTIAKDPYDIDMDQVICKAESLEIVIDSYVVYPAHLRVDDIPERQVTPELIVDLVRDAYEEIYRLEEPEKLALPFQDNLSAHEKTGLMLRREPDPVRMFGTHSHEITDLSIEHIEVLDTGNRHVIVKIAIGS